MDVTANRHPTPWLVEYTNKTRKQKDKLPLIIKDIFYIFKGELEQEGPDQQEWRNYSMIVNARDVHHCHLNNNHPRYVVVWKVVDREKKNIEIRYVGPHGSVNYDRFK
jgi:hypothetical protein